MKLTVRKPVEIEAVAIRVCAAVRYGEEDIPNDFPFRRGDVWDVTIDFATRKIRDWPDVPAQVHMKVCDEGSYYLLGPNDEVLASIEEGYVPNPVVPGKCGDYVEMKIAADGTVSGLEKEWRFDEYDVGECFFREDD